MIGDIYMKKEEVLSLLEGRHILSEENLKRGQVRTFAKGEYLLHQGTQLRNIYILIQGKVRTIHNNANGTAVYNGLSLPIDILGQIELMNGQVISHDAMALSDCVTLSFSVANDGAALLNDNVFLRYISSSLAMICYNAEINSSISINFPVENRLASYLLAYARNDQVKMNMAAAAPMIGSSYRHLQRVMAQFIDKGYIAKKKRGLYEIKDHAKLAALSEDAYHFRS